MDCEEIRVDMRDTTPKEMENGRRMMQLMFCLNHTEAGQVEVVATVYSPTSGRVLEVLNDQPGLQFFTGGRTAMALESQLYPDTPNHPEFPGNAVLRPGETYHHTVIYRFSTK